jgi:hypothetical protein
VSTWRKAPPGDLHTDAIYDAHGEVISFVRYPERDADLIAAAPELRDVLAAVVAADDAVFDVPADSPDLGQVILQQEKAIAAARTLLARLENPS